ncbi:MAG: HAD family hydrolase [Gammaproteobacteria bacterium]|jgi:HAD superfamily hydrolase (TIGR01490 family)
MPLALFDLDNTLLAGDSDYLWGCFLVDKGLVDKQLYEEANQRFYREYTEGTLDIHEFLNFALQPLAKNDAEVLRSFHQAFMEQHIRPIMTHLGQELINKHRQQGDHPVIITATNSFVTGPIARAFGVSDLIATEPEIINGQYTGKVAGTPCFQHGKIERLHAWLEQTKMDFDDSWFYSDSHNDLPLLEAVAHPVAVDPDDPLRAIAAERGWPIRSFRNSQNVGV